MYPNSRVEMQRGNIRQLTYNSDLFWKNLRVNEKQPLTVPFFFIIHCHLIAIDLYKDKQGDHSLYLCFQLLCAIDVASVKIRELYRDSD